MVLTPGQSNNKQTKQMCTGNRIYAVQHNKQTIRRKKNLKQFYKKFQKLLLSGTFLFFRILVFMFQIMLYFSDL